MIATQREKQKTGTRAYQFLTDQRTVCTSACRINLDETVHFWSWKGAVATPRLLGNQMLFQEDPIESEAKKNTKN